ncbi:MAG: 16S rRNA (uracil(1498)-N(3))-methyltransferase [Alphaproteobacteria bacterium]
MPTIPRLYVTGALAAGAVVETDDVHYLRTVLRLGPGAPVELFNGHDGGWRGRIAALGKKAAAIAVENRVAAQVAVPDLALLFAPLKKARIDFLVEKATELGVGALCPVLTDHSITDRVNVARLAEVAREAAEQSGRLCVPPVSAPVRLRDALEPLEREGRRLFVADETHGGAPALDAFRAAGAGAAAILVGPEGGFAASELDLLRRLPIVTAIDLGPRILRAETAAIAALACWQAACGDWRSSGT